MTGFSIESESCKSTHLSSGLTLQQRQQHVVTVCSRNRDLAEQGTLNYIC
jgi:hypothetical protein